MHSANIEERDYLRDVVSRLTDAPHGQRGRVIDDACRALGWSPDRVYRGLKSVSYSPSRQPRADRGRCGVIEEEMQDIAATMTESCRANGKRLLSVAVAMDILRGNGQLETTLSPTRMRRIMRERGLHPNQLARPTPHTSMRSLHPNHVWQFDVSICVLFYLDRGGLQVMDEKRFYKNKPANLARIEKQRVLRYLLTDHYSGTLFLKYYLGPGETQPLLFEFLMEAFGGRDHPQDPFKGVPLKLVWDAGSANQSYAIRDLLDRLDVRHWSHIPGNPRAKGQVENAHNLVETGFEGRLALMDIHDIDQLNEAAHKWMRYFNGAVSHSRHGSTRYGLWQTIREEQLRVCPPRALCQQLLGSKPAPRKVKGDLTIDYTIKGHEPASYSVKHVPGIGIGETVYVSVNPYHAPNVYVTLRDLKDEPRYECMPLARDAAGFFTEAPVFGDYCSAPDTDTDRQRKAIAKRAYSVETEAEVDKARKARTPAFRGTIDPINYLEHQTTAHYMARPGTEIGLPDRAHVEHQPLGHVEALKRLRSLLGRALTPADNRCVRERYPGGVPEEVLDELAAWLRGEVPASQATAV
ncbi:MAG: transposase [Gammaproteobacteria bacterium]